MKFTLIVCTYMRSSALLNLLNSVKLQTVYPSQIIIVDGSTTTETKEIIDKNLFENLDYFLVDNENRGLTKQRNFGISKVASDSEVVCFLDDDTILNKDYFKEIIATYYLYPEAKGVGGHIINESIWQKADENYVNKLSEFYYDGWYIKDSTRFVLRKLLGLDSDKNPGYMPEYSHGRGIGFLPPSGKIYEVEQFKGGVSSFRNTVFNDFKFSTFFEGYGLYEDADFTLRVSKSGKLFVNTRAQLSHFHDSCGRPNKYLYGKMVVKNGWYVWRVKYFNPSLKARMKWNLITLLLSVVLLSSIFKSNKKLEVIQEFFGRISAWFSLTIRKNEI